MRVLPELDFGGLESRVELQARLHERDRFRLRVCIFNKPGKASNAVRALGVPVDVLGVSPDPRNPGAPLALARYLRRLRPDVVHASSAEGNLHALIASRLVDIPALIVEEIGMPSHGRLARTVFSVAYRSASAIVGVTEAVCDYLRTIDRAPEHRVRLIYNCADPRYFPPERAPTGRANDGKLRLLIVARLVPVKNHLLFLEALGPALAVHPNVEVTIAGDGPLKDALVSKIEALGLARRVSLLGFRDDVRSLLERAHVYALPSLSEGCSISLIEAMASGVHTIGSAVPGIAEVMGSELSKDWTAPPGSREAWTALLLRVFALAEAERAAIALRGQERAYAQFSPVAYVHRVEALYSELLGSRRPS